MFTHEALGEPFPQGTAAHANSMAQQRSGASPHAHHVVQDMESGAHSVTMQPDPETQQIVQTFQGGQPVPAPEQDPEAAAEPEGEMPADQGAPEDQQAAAPEAAAESLDAIDRLLSESGFVRSKIAPRQIDDISRYVVQEVDAPAPRRSADVQQEMRDELEEMLKLYQNSNLRSLSRIDEAVPVDSNRGVTTRGNSAYDKFTSPETREKVLRSRTDEIDAFARSRSIPTSNIYAATEAAMRTGKVPDLGQYGLAGDDAVATKQFIISNILNVQGLEDINYGGSSIHEGDDVAAPAPGPGDDHHKKMVQRIKQHVKPGGRVDYEAMPDELLHYMAGKGDPRARGHIRMRKNPPKPLKLDRPPKHITWHNRAYYEDEEGLEEAHGTSHLETSLGPFVAPGTKVKKATRRADKLPKMEGVKGGRRAGLIDRDRGYDREPSETGVFKSVTRKDPSKMMSSGERERAREFEPEPGSKAERHPSWIGTDPENPTGVTIRKRDSLGKKADKIRKMQQSGVDVDPTQFMAEGSTSIRSLGKGGHVDAGGDFLPDPRFAGHRPMVGKTAKGEYYANRRRNRAIEVEKDALEPGSTVREIAKRRRSDAENRQRVADAGKLTPEGKVPSAPKKEKRAMYARKKRERAAYTVQADDTYIDPTSYMAEGSGGRRALERKYEAAKKAHDANIKRIGSEPYEITQKRLASTRAREAAARARERQRYQQRPPGGHERMAAKVKRKEAYDKAGFPGHITLPSQRNPESRVGRPDGGDGGGQGWPINRAATRVKRGQEKLRRMRQTSSVDLDPSRFMVEAQWDYQCSGCGARHSEREFERAHESGECHKCGESAINIDAVPRRRPSKTTPKNEEAGYLGEEGGPYRTGGAPHRAALSPTRSNPGSDAPVGGHWEKEDLLPKKVMQALKKEIGDRVHGYPRAELFRLARERGLLGTEESVSREADSILGIAEGDPRSGSWPKLDSDLARLLKADPSSKTLAGTSFGPSPEIGLAEDDYKGIAHHYGGKYLGYVQPYQGMYEFPSEDSATRFANHCAAKTKSVPHVSGKRVSVDEPKMHEAGHLGYAGHAGPMSGASPHSSMGSDKSPSEIKDKKSKKKVEDTHQSSTDNILGIDDQDPRAQSWPKMSEEMRKLLNLEDNRYMAPRPGARVDFEEKPVQEATFGGANVGAFLGGNLGGQLGAHLMQRTQQTPPYDTSVDVSNCERDEKVRRMRDLLKRVGLRPE